MIVEVRLGHIVAELAVRHGIQFQAGVHTGLVQRHRVKGGKHAHVGQDGQVVLGMAVAEGADVDDQADVEVGTPLHHGQGVFGDLAVQDVVALVLGRAGGILGAGADAAAAAHALVVVDGCLAALDGNGIVGAVLLADGAADALVLVHIGLAGGVHLHLAGAGAAAHADVLDRAAEARALVALEVGQGEEGVVVHKVFAHAHFGEPLAAGDRQHHGAVGVQNVHRGKGPAVDLQGLPVLLGGVAVALVEGVGLDKDGNYVITAAAGMNWFANEVDNGDSFEGKTIKLDTDIILPKDINWNPIGDNRTDAVFSGTFDGQNHTIYGAHISGDFCFDGSVYGSKEGWGLFSALYRANVKNLKVDNATFASYTVISGAIAGYAQDTTFENIEITNSTIAGYNWYCGGVVGWASGDCTFKNVNLDNTTSVGTLWGAHGQCIGGIAGGISSSGNIVIEDCNIACVIDAINDVVSNYQWWIYRVSGMIIGNITTTQTINGREYPNPTNVTCKNVTVTYGDWMNYHYCEFERLGAPSYASEGQWKFCRVEGSDYGTDGVDHTMCNHDSDETHYVLIPFDQLFGGGSNGSGREPVYGLRTFNGVTVVYPASYSETVADDAQLKEALAAGVPTVYVTAGEYTFPAGSVKEGTTINCAEGTVFTGKSSLNIKGATVIGATFRNENGTTVSGTIDGTFKDCTFEGSETLRWCYSSEGKPVVFEDCVFKTDFRGVHFDTMSGDVTFRRCELNGFNAYGGTGTMTFEECVFGNDESSYNGLNIYATTILKDCRFVYESGKTNFIDMECTGKSLTITNCTATLDGAAADVRSFVGGSKLAENTVTIDGVVL